MRNIHRITLTLVGFAALLWWATGGLPGTGDPSAERSDDDSPRAVHATEDPLRADLESASRADAKLGGEPADVAPVPLGALGEEAVSQLAPPPLPDETEARERDPLPSPGVSIELDPLASGANSAFAYGFDPGAPRPLLLWRRVGDRVAIMARGRSLADGSLEFPELVIPDAGLEVVVTSIDDTPDGASASTTRSLGRRPLLPPRARALATPASAPSEVALRITPSEARGEILVAASGGEIFARHPLPTSPYPAQRSVDLLLRVPDSDEVVWLAHELPDGRRSDWWAFALPPVTIGDDR